jgi:splicing factor 3B subunit 2
VEPPERTLWGELQPPAEESEEEEDEDESEEEEGSEVGDLPPGGTETHSGLETPGGYASTVHTDMHAPSGVETSMAGEFDLRKTRRGFETEDSSYGAPRQAYTVIPERQGRAEGFFGSDKTYDLSKPPPVPPPSVPVLGRGDDDSSRKRKKPGDVEVALDPDALMASGGINKEELKRQFEANRREEGVGAQWNKTAYEEDLSDMISQEIRKRQKRDEERREKGGRR